MELNKSLWKAMAVIIAEHEVMRNRLIEIEEIYDDVPLRWRGSGNPIINLEETIDKFLRERGLL